jgi:hypothetical protein
MLEKQSRSTSVLGGISSEMVRRNPMAQSGLNISINSGIILNTPQSIRKVVPECQSGILSSRGLALLKKNKRTQGIF